jgi:hypothetical protein
MDPVTLIAAINAASALLTGLVRAAEAKFAAGEMTEDEIRLVRIRAKHSDDAWDERVEEARRRLAAKSAGQ